MTPEEFRFLPESRRAALFATLPREERAAYRDTSLLSPQLDPHRGWRVEVVDHDGNIRRFIVGRSQGWRPRNIELKKVSSRKGPPADRRGYKSVTLLRRVRHHVDIPAAAPSSIPAERANVGAVGTGELGGSGTTRWHHTISQTVAVAAPPSVAGGPE